MKILSILFLASLLLGQIGGIPIYPGAVLYVHDIVLGLLVIEGFVQYAIRSKLKKPKLLSPILLFVAAAVLSLLTNSGKFQIPELEVSAMYLARWIFYVSLYVLVRQVYTMAEFWLYGLFATGTGLGVLGLAQFFLYPNLRNLAYLGWDPHYYRLFSTFLDPNFAGIYLVLTVLLGIYLWHYKRTRWCIVIGELISITAILLTYSRSSYLALSAAVTIWILMKKRWKFLLVLIIFAVLVFSLPQIWGTTLSLTRPDSTFARIGNWKESLALIAKAPIFGYGFDTLRYVRVLPPGQFFSRSAAGFDSSILFILATTGIVGLCAFGYLLYAMIRNAQGRMFALYVVSFIALGIHSLFVNSAFYPWVMIWFWILTGVSERISGGT